MNPLIYGIIFFVCVVLYIHILYHLKKTTDEKVYDITFSNKTELNTVCDIRSPFIFQTHKDKLLTNDALKDNNIHLNTTYSRRSPKKEDEESATCIFSEFNHTAIQSEIVTNSMNAYEQIYMQPEFTLCNNRDMIVSDKGFKTSLESNYNFRNFFHCNEGIVKVNLISPIHSDKIEHHFDYERYRNVSSESILDTHMKTIELTLTEGDVLYVPSFWWYSFEFNERTILMKYQYRSVMNILSHLPFYLHSIVAKQKRMETDQIGGLKLKV